MRLNATVLARSALLAAALAVGACEKQVREAKTEPADKPGQTAVADASVTGDPTPAAATVKAPSPKQAADTQPALAVLMIDGVAVQFPPTKLLLAAGVDRDRGNDSPVSAELFSDLPKSALRKYAGNELYLEVKLQGGNGPQKLEGAAWQFKSESSEKADSPNGIFLNGQSTHLQPTYALLKLDRRKDGQLVAQLAGQFRAFENGTPESLAPFVEVRGELPVEIVQKR